MSVLGKVPLEMARIEAWHLILYDDITTVATIVFRLILAKFRPNSDQKNTEIQTKFRLILTIFNRNSDLLKLANWVRLRLR